MGNGEGSDGGTETWKGQTKRERDRHIHTDSSETEGEVGREQNRQNHPQMRVYKGANKSKREEEKRTKEKS